MLLPTGGKRGGPDKAPAENAGGPLLIKLPDAPVGGTTGGALIGGEVKGLGLGRAPRVGGGGGTSGPAGGEPPGGGTPDTGAAAALPTDDERELGGGLNPNNDG